MHKLPIIFLLCFSTARFSYKNNLVLCAEMLHHQWPDKNIGLWEKMFRLCIKFFKYIIDALAEKNDTYVFKRIKIMHLNTAYKHTYQLIMG